MNVLRPLALMATLVLGLTACGSGGGSSDSTRVAFVEVSSVPSGQPVELQLNSTKLDVTTPDSRNVKYDTFCTLRASDFGGTGTCSIIASVNFKGANGHGSLTLCVTDKNTKCGTSDQGFIVLSVDYKP